MSIEKETKSVINQIIMDEVSDFSFDDDENDADDNFFVESDEPWKALFDYKIHLEDVDIVFEENNPFETAEPAIENDIIELFLMNKNREEDRAV